MASVIKDAGDDPDVTDKAEVVATLRLRGDGGGIRFVAGEGVGTVTRAGLPIPPGEPAINPVPRRMMTEMLEAEAIRTGHGLDLDVEIAIPGGAELALRTLNPRLGIVGGLSILGTTGIVIPYSCSSWIHSIHRGVDVARAAGLAHIAACTGSTSERTVQALYDLPDMALLDMGDFAGGTLKYLKRKPVARVTLAGGFAKLAKLAQGHLDLHSSRSEVDVGDLAQRARGDRSGCRRCGTRGLLGGRGAGGGGCPRAGAGRADRCAGQGQGARCRRRQAGAGGHRRRPRRPGDRPCQRLVSGRIC